MYSRSLPNAPLIGRKRREGDDTETSALNLGAAILKSQSIGSRLQREIPKGEVQSLYIRKLGQDTVVRVDIRHNLIETVTL